jgi:hypothetical protein
VLHEFGGRYGEVLALLPSGLAVQIKLVTLADHRDEPLSVHCPARRVTGE